MKTEAVPTIDIHQLDSNQTLAELDYACRDWGFFQITNHGIPESTTSRLADRMGEFFAQPGNVKREISRTRDNPWGFFDRELTKNVQDWKEVFDYGPADGDVIQPQWPQDIPGFRDAVYEYFSACEALALRLVSAISTNLGMPPEFLGRGFGPGHSSFLRLNYYPVCPPMDAPGISEDSENEPLGISQHTDAGALTVLLQDNQPGLEVYKDGGWHLVEPTSGALVINIGDIVQVWSNDVYRAALHRVVTNAENARYSAPFFFNTEYKPNYAPVPNMVSDESPAQYREINWGEFRGQRHAGDYANYGEEVQISHYKVPRD